jgi:hypothetical protein
MSVLSYRAYTARALAARLASVFNCALRQSDSGVADRPRIDGMNRLSLYDIAKCNVLGWHSDVNIIDWICLPLRAEWRRSTRLEESLRLV